MDDQNEDEDFNFFRVFRIFGKISEAKSIALGGTELLDSSLDSIQRNYQLR